MTRVCSSSGIVLPVILMLGVTAGAQPPEGTVLRTIDSGNSWTVGFDGTFLYWIDVDDAATLHKIDTNGEPQDDIGITDCNPFGGEATSISWDPTRNVFWGAAFGVVSQITTAGVCTAWFDVDAAVGGSRDDVVGFAYDPSDDSIWYIPDRFGSPVFHFAIPPAPIAGYIAHPGLPSFVATPKPCPASRVNGLATGADPAILYLSAFPCGNIMMYDKTNGAEVGLFPISPVPPQTDDIECDPVTFAGQGTDALWVADRLSETLNAVAVAQGRCASSLTALPIAVDYKLEACPNKLKTWKKGEWMAIAGTASFAVTQIDPATLKIEGVAPLSTGFGDGATPFVPFTGKSNPGDCTAAGADGIVDLLMRVDSGAIAAALGPVSDGDVRVLKLTGNLLAAFGGTPIVGEDVVVIQVK